MDAKTQILAATQDDVRDFAQRRWNDAPSQRLYAQLAADAPGGVWVARDVDTAIGIGFRHVSGDESYVSELYVEPAYRNSGIGTALFDRLFESAATTRSCALLDPNQPAGLGFALGRAVAVRSPIFRFSGVIADEEELATLAYGEYRFHVESIDLNSHGYAIDALDLEVRGCARPDDHRMFASLGNGSAIFLQNEFVGYVYVWPDGRIGPISTASAAYSAQCFAFGLVTLRRALGVTWCSAGIPGENLRVARAALQVGLKIDSMRLFASEAPFGDFRRYVGFHPLLF